MSDTSSPPTRPPRRRDDPPRGLVPRFTPPPEETELGATTSSSPSPLSPDLQAQARQILDRAELDGPGTPPGPTTTSTTGDDEPPRGKPLSRDEVTGLVVGVLGLVVAVAGGVIRWQTRRRLREPSAKQRRDIAAPLGRILQRRADLSILGPDIGDALQAAAATGAYLGDGPLLHPPDHVIDDGVPDDLQESQ